MDHCDLPAGPELDALVAVKVMGWTRLPDSFDGIVATRVYRDAAGHESSYLPPYSQSIAQAWEVVERMKRTSYDPRQFGGFVATITCTSTSDGVWRAAFTDWQEEDPATGRASGHAEAPTAPLAICRAAISALSA